MEYTLRELKATDMGQVCKIISLIGAKEFKDAFDVTGMKDADPQAVGVEVIFGIAGVVVENLPKAQSEVDKFLSSLTGMKVKEIQEMNFADYGDLIVQVITKDDFKDFFSHVMKLFNR